MNASPEYVTILAVGKPIPLPLPLPKNAGGLCWLEDGGGFFFAVTLPRITPKEIGLFQSGPITLGIYDCSDFTWGLPLWAWGAWVQEGSMDIVAEQGIHAQAVHDWLHGKANMMTMILIDQDTNIIKALRCIGLHADYVGHLTACWLRQLEKQPAYEQARQQLMDEYTTDQLWALSKLYPFVRA